MAKDFKERLQDWAKRDPEHVTIKTVEPGLLRKQLECNHEWIEHPDWQSSRCRKCGWPSR